MKPWIIDRIEHDRRRQEWKPVPLHIQQPPPEWIERQREQQRRQERSDRGVCIIGDETPSDRGVTIIDL